MCQRLNDEHRLGHALLTLSIVASLQDEIPAARAAIEQAVVLAEENGDQPQLARLRARSAFLELMDGNVGRSIELYNTAIALFLELGDQDGVLNSRYNMTWALRKMGRLEESHRQLRETAPAVAAACRAGMAGGGG